MFIAAAAVLAVFTAAAVLQLSLSARRIPCTQNSYSNKSDLAESDF